MAHGVAKHWVTQSGSREQQCIGIALLETKTHLYRL